MLNNAKTLDDLRIPPANRLETLKGKRKGQHSNPDKRSVAYLFYLVQW